MNFYPITLPNGKVLAVGGDGGSLTTGRSDCTNPVYAAELYDPVADTWTVVASMSEPRMYHSAALLLPSGKVLIGGGECRPLIGEDCDGETFCCLTDECGGSEEVCHDLDFQFTVQVYNPPYLFNGTRPTITTPPAEINYGNPFVIFTPDASGITSVSLIRLGSTTHSSDFDQRFMNLNFNYSPQQSDRITVAAPPHGNAAPPGYYMLFILRGDVPSTAAIVRVRTNPGGS